MVDNECAFSWICNSKDQSHECQSLLFFSITPQVIVHLQVNLHPGFHLKSS